MIDWTTVIISTLGGVSITGIFGSVFFYRENKKIKNAEVNKETATAMKEDASAAKEMLEVARDMKGILSDFNKTLKATIDERDSTIAAKDKRIDELERQVRELSFTVSEQQRQIAGMQRTITKEVSRKKYAEDSICLSGDCQMRRPKKGTFNSDNDDIRTPDKRK